MSKLLMLSGLQASGKSTRAKEILTTSGNCVRLNKDLLRTMLHFDKFNGRNEGLTIDAERTLAKMFLLKGINVVVDDTNLGFRYKQSWSQLATECNAKFEHATLTTELSECLNRNSNRVNSVPAHVIVQTAMKQRMLPSPDKAFVICDIDGTLADITHRRHFVQPLVDSTGEFVKDWKSFFEAATDDTLRTDIYEQVKTYSQSGHQVILVSGRPETYRKQTEEWLAKVGVAPVTTLFMRKEGDSREDTVIKKEIYDTYLKHYPVEVVFDDRNRIIQMWREQGLRVIDCGDGVEF